MNFSDIIVDASLWQWALIVSVAVGLTLLRYAVLRFNLKTWFLAAIRLSVLATLLFLLLEPLLRTTTTELEPSTIVIVNDASRSQWQGEDSIARKNALAQLALAIPEKFKESGFEVKVFDFGRQLINRTPETTSITWKADEAVTDISSALSSLNDRFSHRNVEAVIFSSDGLSNRGSDPEFGTQMLDVPHFFIGTGDTTLVKDVQITDLLCNQVTYLNNQFPIEVRLKSQGFAGKEVKVKVYLGSVLREEVVWDIKEEVSFETLGFNLEADKVGSSRVKVVVSILEGESQTSNNSATVYVDVLESKREIIIVANAPHPDVAAIKNALKTNFHQDVKVVFASDITNNDLPQHDVLVLHDLPNIRTTLPAIINKEIASDMPVLFIGGPQMDWSSLAIERVGIEVESSEGLQEIGGVVHSGFGLFEVPEGLTNKLKSWPPLTSSFGTVKTSKNLEPLIFQSLGNLKTEWPLMGFNRDASGRRSAVLLGEGIWRWRSENYLQDENFEVFDDLINRSIQYLDSRDDVRRFRVKAPKRIEEDEHFRLSAQVYDASLNPTTNVDVMMVLTNSLNEDFDFVFSTSEEHYKLDCGRLQPGEYNWSASCILDGEVRIVRGILNVLEIKAELASKSADHNLLMRLGEKTGGILLGSVSTTFSEESSERWVTLILAQVNKRDIMHEFTQRIDMININAILWLILTALSLEWIIRRRQGGY